MRLVQSPREMRVSADTVDMCVPYDVHTAASTRRCLRPSALVCLCLSFSPLHDKHDPSCRQMTAASVGERWRLRLISFQAPETIFCLGCKADMLTRFQISVSCVLSRLPRPSKHNCAWYATPSVTQAFQSK